MHHLSAKTDEARLDWQPDPQKRFAEQRRADIRRRLRALELVYEAQTRRPTQDRD